MFFNNKVQSLLPALFPYYLCLISGAVDRWVLSLESRGAQWALSQETELVHPTCTKGINMDELTFDPHVRAQHKYGPGLCRSINNGHTYGLASSTLST